MELENVELDELRIRPSGNRPTDNLPEWEGEHYQNRVRESQLCIGHTFSLISPVKATQSKIRENEQDTDPVTATYIDHVTAT